MTTQLSSTAYMLWVLQLDVWVGCFARLLLLLLGLDVSTHEHSKDCSSLKGTGMPGTTGAYKTVG